jgi:serine/threonine-protein kinase
MVTSDLGACEWFVWDLRRSGLIDRGQLDTIVSEFLKRNPRAEAPALADFLVQQGILTAFQAERVLNGKSQGLVLGPYVLLEAIGSGSMGQVYKASSKNDTNLYAVKVLPRRNMWNVRLARRQVRSFSGFTHPAVVPFMDVGTAGGLHYLVWPLAEGTTLDALVQQMGKLPPSLATLYGLQIAQGLYVAHQNNLFHGLLKPSNIMIGSDNQARILDFGIGSLLVENDGESLVDTMSTANTLTSGLDCASPESIMEPTNRTPAGDQYSLGCVLYFCLTGQVPFPNGSAVEKMMAHQTREPTPIRELAPNVPDGLAAIVSKLMAKNPEQRYSACDEVVEALEPFIGDLATLARSVATRPQSTASSSNSRLGTLGNSRPGGSNLKSAGSTTPIPSTSPATSSADRVNGTVTPPPAGDRSLPRTSGSHHGTRPAANLPSRASFQLPPIPEQAATSASSWMNPPPPTTVPVPTRTGSPAGQRETRAPQPAGESPSTALNWAEKVDDSPQRSFGPVGLIAVALLLMVSVYFGAIMLMK